MKQGAIANQAGQLAERQVLSRLEQVGYRMLSEDERRYHVMHKIKQGGSAAEAMRDFGEPVCTYQIKAFNTIYGTPCRVDVFAVSEQFPKGLAIIVKWQSSSGSVDEKLPFAMLNLDRAPVSQAALVMGGGGARAAAMQWAKEAETDKVRVFCEIGEYFRWCKNGFSAMPSTKVEGQLF